MATNLVANVTVSGNLNALTMNSSTLNVSSGFSLNNQLYTTSFVSASSNVTGPSAPAVNTGPAAPANTTGPSAPAVTTGPAAPANTTGPAAPANTTVSLTKPKIASAPHTAVILQDGTVQTFGYNANGQLGNNSTQDSAVPVRVWGISSSASSIACGYYHTVVLLVDGTVRTFGRNNYGQLGVNDTSDRSTPVQVWVISSSAVMVAAGFQHSAVVLADGTVRTFGRNSSGQLGVNDATERLTPAQVWGISSSATAVACGRLHTCVLLANGTVQSFGYNAYGQLGVNDQTDRSTPVQVLNITNATAVACGNYHTCVLLADGTVRTFGRNAFGNLGVNDTTDRSTPVQVLNITNASAVACGGQHSIVLLSDGTLRTFGYNLYGNLGVNDKISKLTPVQVWGISSSAVAIATGISDATVMLSSDGTLRTTGYNNKGQLGDGTVVNKSTPVQVLDIPFIRPKIGFGLTNMAVILDDGTVRTFGSNSFGELGNNTRQDSAVPVRVWGISSSAAAVSCGRSHVIVLLADGTLRAFGRNDAGQLGVGDTAGRLTPVQVLNITNATSVACGGINTCVLLPDGTVRTFGYNNYGQLGVNDNTARPTPVQVLNITSATAVACGSNHAAVLLTNGTVWAFGRNDSGQLGVNDTTSRLTPVQVMNITSATAIACGTYHSSVLLADGTVQTFGYNTYGGLGVNDTTSRLTPVQVWGISSSAVAISCGNIHTGVLLADGTLRAFGYNGSGQLGVTGTTQRNTPVQVWGISSSAVAIACGYNNTAALLVDGTVRTVGLGDSGQLGDGTVVNKLTPVQVLNIPVIRTQIAAGGSYTAVLLANGTVRMFGAGNSGVLGNNSTQDSAVPVQVWGISSSAVSVSCSGGFNTAVLLGDGTVRTFGRNSGGQLGVNDTTSRLTPVQVWGISSSAILVSCGNYFTSVLLADGTVRAFGRNDVGQLGVNDNLTRLTPVTVLNITSATALACGSSHSVILLADGTVRTFGLNANGQLGVNDTTDRSTPVPVLNITSAVAVAGATDSTAILLADGTVWAFGNNFYGQLGVNDNITRLTPVQVWGISSSAVAIAIKRGTTAVLLADGTVRTFGQNSSGQLGVNDTTSRLTPVQVWGISSSAVTIAVGYYHVAVTLADGTVRTFGKNDNGQLGDGTVVNKSTAVQVLNVPNRTVQVSSQRDHTAILLQNGTVATFGEGVNGKLGVNSTRASAIPLQVWGISSSAISVAVGRDHTCVLLADGTVRSFGLNNSGQLGVNDPTNRSTPVQVWGISSSAVSVTCGWYFTAVLLKDGTIRTFGSNSSGQLGVNDATNRSTPVQVLNITSATAIACGSGHLIAILNDGTVRTVGSNGFGQLGVNDTTTRQTPVQVLNITSAIAVAGGISHTAVLLADGTVRTFGSGTLGRLGVNDTADRSTPVQVWGISSSAVAVACGQYNTIVLLADGTVRTIGRNTAGELGVNDTTSRQTPVQVWGISSSAVAISGGYLQTCYGLLDGTVRTIGYNVLGNLGDGTVVNKLTPVQVLNVPYRNTVCAMGQSHTSIVLADGTVRTFGLNNRGQLGVNDTTTRSTPVQVWGISSSATSVSGGSSFTAVLLADGTVRTFGYNNNGQLGVGGTASRLTPVQFGTISTAVVLSCGVYNTGVVLNNGTVWVSGDGFYGQTGTNSTSNRLLPIQVWGISSSAVSIAYGSYHAAVLLADGTVWAFGRNSQGALGVNDTTSRLTPVQVPNITSAVAISAGFDYTYFLLSNGTVWGTGQNAYGQLGVNDTTSRLTPVQMLNITSAVAISAGWSCTIISLADGTVRSLGRNDFGQLGVNDTTSRLTPVQVWGISSSAVAIVAAQVGTSSMVVLTDGTVRTFGNNSQGQLGLGDTTSRLTPVQVLNVPNRRVQVAGGGNHTAVLLTDGTVRTFGQNNLGQLGVNDTTPRFTSVQVWGISSSAIAVSCGLYHTVVLLTDGTVRAFGRNTAGNLGVNDTTSRFTPVQVWGISSSAVAIAGGENHTAVILADGTVRTFGANLTGQLGDNSTSQKITPVQVWGISSGAVAVACGRSFTCVLLADGTVRTFGSNSFGQLGVNDTTSRLTPVQVLNITSATAIACGRQQTFVLLTNGTVQAFGRNGFGSLGVNDTTDRSTPVQVLNITNAIAVTAASYTTTVLLADGTVRTFGYNTDGQLGVNDTVRRSTPIQVWGISSSAVAIATGTLSYHVAVVLADGTVRTFGQNGSGQLGMGDTVSRLTPVQVLYLPASAYYLNSNCLSIGLLTPQYQLDMSTDTARKLTTSTWLTGSDERIKTDIESANLARCVEIVDSLDLKYFKWDFPNSETRDKHSLGWIAQEVKEFLPKSVRTTQDHGLADFHNLDSDQLIKVMYGTLKHMINETYPTGQE